MTLRIGFNATTLSEPRMAGGINRHFLGLLRALKNLSRDCELHFFTDRAIAPAHAGDLDGGAVHASDVRPRLLWEQVSLPIACAGARIDLFHSPIGLGLPRLSPGFSRVLTLHDLYTLRDMETPLSWAHAKGLLSLRASWMAVESADAVITVSRYSKNEILKRFPDWERKVHVVHNGVEGRFSPGRPDPPVLARHCLGSPYALYVGSFGPRKNVSLLAGGLKAARGKLTLALAGDHSEAPADLRAAFQGLHDVKWLGYVEDLDLPDLYRGAVCAVVPSREEGFGFQVIEAMACGCPVLSSNAASLPEIGGAAAAYFAPDDPKALGGLLDRVTTDEPWRNGLIEAGLRRAPEFTWEKAAKSTLELYRRILRSR